MKKKQEKKGLTIEERREAIRKSEHFAVSQKLLVYNTEKKQYLCIFNANNDWWELPGGVIDKGENFENALKREVQEELGEGFEYSKPEFLGTKDTTITFEENTYRILYACYLAEYGEGEIGLSKEHSDISWKSLEEIQACSDKEMWPAVKGFVKAAEEMRSQQEALNGWRRCLADFENYKKRQSESGRELADRAVEGVVSGLLPVLDNLNASLAHVPESHKDDPWVMGMTYIYKQFADALREAGVEEVDVEEGDVFDPEFHEAVESSDKEQVTCDKEGTEQPKATSPQMRGSGESSSRGGGESVKEVDNESSKVKKVVQKGYVLKGRVVRAARVVVG